MASLSALEEAIHKAGKGPLSLIWGGRPLEEAEELVVALLVAILERLRSIDEGQAAALAQVAAGGAHAERIIENWPVAGRHRRVMAARADGDDSFACPAGTAVQVRGNEPARAGGRLVNSGSTAVIVYLCYPGEVSSDQAAIWLASNGGSWDLLLSGMVYCGPISAVAQGGASTLTVATF